MSAQQKETVNTALKVILGIVIAYFGWSLNRIVVKIDESSDSINKLEQRMVRMETSIKFILKETSDE
jgi:hypothetical protein